MQSNNEEKNHGDQEEKANMTVITNAQKKKLDAIEARMRGNLESFVQMGLDLETIFQERLYKVKGYQTFSDYCRKEWDLSSDHVKSLRLAAEVRLRLPDLENRAQALSSEKNVKEKKNVWTEKAIRPLTSLSPAKQRQVGAAVAKAVNAGEAKPTSTTVKKFIRKLVPESIVPREPRLQEPEKPMMEDFLNRHSHAIERVTEAINEIDPIQWTDFTRRKPAVLRRLKSAIDDLSKAVNKRKERTVS